MQKLFFSLLSLLCSLVGLYGALHLGWHWEMAVPGALTLLFLGLALVSGNRTYLELLEECEEDLPEEKPAAAGRMPFVEVVEAGHAEHDGRPELLAEGGPALRPARETCKLIPAPVEEKEELCVRRPIASPVPATRRGRHHTQRLEWGQVDELLRSVDGPSRF
ncbi:MAG: hypothetical protein FJ109_18950 [Deltaproteobacteria bacterium]|nr:hypothetical protein [Deltaproteobacteria bacterium]